MMIRTIATAFFAAMFISGAAVAHLKDLTWVEMTGWQPDNITRVVALDHNGHAGEFMYVLSDPEQGEFEGRQCVRGGLFAFDVDDGFAFDIDEDVTLEVTLHRASSVGFVTAYDAATEHTVAKNHDIDQSLDSPFHTATITLVRAAFANRTRAASDILIAAKGSIFQGILEVTPETSITICDVKIRRDTPKPQPVANAKWKLQVKDENGERSPARVGLYDETGRALLPSKDALRVTHLYAKDRRRAFSINQNSEHWPGRGRYIFWIDGEYDMELPAGDYQVVVSKGFEYRIVDQIITVEPDTTTTTQIALERWTDMPAQGWYSGDDHIHLARSRFGNRALSALIKAEDIHMGFMLQMGNVNQTFFEQYAFGKRGEYQKGNHALVSGQENPRTGDLGHVISLNTQKYHDYDDYYLYGDVADAVHAEGGLWGYAHIAFGDAIGMPESMAHTVPFGQVDFVEQLQFRYMFTEMLYDFLNLGFDITPIAGSDAPYLNLIGAERFYVHTGEDTLDTQAFYDGLDAGKVFVTSGPMMSLTVNEQPIGSAVNIAKGEKVTVTVTASVNPDIDQMDRIELVVHGKVVATMHSESGAESLTLTHELTPEESLWLAARAFGKKQVNPYLHQTQAHTAASFVLVDGDDFFGDRDQLEVLTAKYKARLDLLYDKRPRAVLQNERDHFTQEDVDTIWDRSLVELRRRVDEARKIYDERLKTYGRSATQ